MLHDKMAKKIIAYAVFFILLAGFASADKYFVLDVNYIQGSLTFNGVDLKEIPSKVKFEESSGFAIRLMSFDGVELKKIYYPITENRRYAIYLPYDKNAAQIEVENLKNSKVMEVDLRDLNFADTCGNGACEDYESYESCTQDCKSGSKDDFCDGVSDGICDPDCSPKTDVDCIEPMNKAENQTPTQASQKPAGKNDKPATKPKIPKTSNPLPDINFLMVGLAIGAVAVLALGYLLVKKIKENHVVSSIRGYIAENVQKGYSIQQIRFTLAKAGYKKDEIDKAIKTI